MTVPKGDKQAAALLALCGAVPPQDVVEVLTHNGAANFSTFYGYYMLEALAMAGEYQQAMDLLGTYWGGMLELVQRPFGRTSIWPGWKMPPVLTAWSPRERQTSTANTGRIATAASATACATAGLRDRRRGSPGTYWLLPGRCGKHWSSNRIWAHWSGQRDLPHGQRSGKGPP